MIPGAPCAARHALVVGLPVRGPENSSMAMVFSAVGAPAPAASRPAIAVRSCKTPRELLEVVAALAADGPLDVLDLYDHAVPGEQMLGDGVLFRSDGDPDHALVGADIAVALRPYLARTAHLRLLGCQTALGRRGRVLLFQLTRLLGELRVAYGTIRNTDEHDFDRGGFKLGSEPEYLFDGLSAIDREAPTKPEREQNFLALLGNAPDA